MYSILTNLSSLAADRQLQDATLRHQRSVARLSSGSRLQSARDDAAGIAVTSRMQAKSRELGTQMRNASDLASTLQIADGALGNIAGNLQRIREIAVRAASDTYTRGDREAMQSEIDALITESRRVQAATEVNGRKLLDGSFVISPDIDGYGSKPALTVAAVFLPRTTDSLVRYAQLARATVTVTPGGALSAGDLTLNGHAIGAAQAGLAGQESDSAWAIANAINAAGIDGLSAQANDNTVTGTSTVLPNNGNVGAGQIAINGIPVGAGNIVNAINAISGSTGVTAYAVGGMPSGGAPATLVLNASNGRSIDVAGAGAYGIADAHAVASLTLTGPLAERPASNIVVAGAGSGNAGLAAGTIPAVDSGTPVAIALDEAAGYDLNPSVLDADLASATIGITERKLDKLLALRVALGAALGRLETASDEMAATRIQTEAAGSRIADADYATEMSEFARSGILQQAGLAIAVQANAGARQVLGLLLGGVRRG